MRRNRPAPRKSLFSRALSLLLSVCLLAPSLASGQPSATPANPQPPTVTGSPTSPPTPPGARPVGAVPAAGPIRSIAGPDYRLGNGDVLEVQIAGRLDVTRIQVIVDPEGIVNIPPLGRHQGRRADVARGQPPDRRARARPAALRRRRASRWPRPACSRSSSRARSSGPGTVPAMATQRLHEVILNAGGITPAGQRAPRPDHAGQRDARGRSAALRAPRRSRARIPTSRTACGSTYRPGRPRWPSAARFGGPGEYELAPDGSLREVLELTGGLAPGGAGVGRAPDPGRRRRAQGDVVGRSAHRAGRRRPTCGCEGGDTLFVPLAHRPAGRRRGAGRLHRQRRQQQDHDGRQDDDRAALRAGPGRARPRRRRSGRAAPPPTPICAWPSSTAAARPAHGSASRSTCIGCWSRRTRPRTSCSRTATC